MSPWKTIDSAPKDGTPILISKLSPYTTEGGGTELEREYVVSKWWRDGWINVNYAEGWCREYPTHWMPLPKHPEGLIP